MQFAKCSTHFGYVFLHYVWGGRQWIPVYKNRSRAVRAIGALNQPKNFFWWRRQTYVLMDDRDQILMLSVFSWICLDHQLAFPLPMVPARYQTLGFTKLSSVQSITCPQRVLPKPYARTIFSVAQNLKHSQYDQSFSHPFTALVGWKTQREGRYL